MAPGSWPSWTVRVATSGSVDDGKSTLIGRMLLEAKQAPDDEMEALAGLGEGAGLAAFTDGLREERERGITIDVAYRSFATPRRRFLLADAPGHVELTRNAVTALSTADVAIVLVDATNGVVDQTRRHAVLASLLRVPHLVVCVNKMDLAGYDRAVFERVRQEFEEMSERLDMPDVAFIPVSALVGDNVTQRSSEMPWYEGAPLVAHLEDLHTSSDRNLVDLRAWVERPIAGLPVAGGAGGGVVSRDLPGCAVRVASGVLRPGDDLVVLAPGGRTAGGEGVGGEGVGGEGVGGGGAGGGGAGGEGAGNLLHVEAMYAPGGRLVSEASPPSSVLLALGEPPTQPPTYRPGRSEGRPPARPVPLPRGALLCRPRNKPAGTRHLDAMAFWIAASPLVPGERFALLHGTRWVDVTVSGVLYRLDVTTLHRDQQVASLVANDIGRVSLVADEPVWADEYSRCKPTGSAILAHKESGATVAALTFRSGGT